MLSFLRALLLLLPVTAYRPQTARGGPKAAPVLSIRSDAPGSRPDVVVRHAPPEPSSAVELGASKSGAAAAAVTADGQVLFSAGGNGTVSDRTLPLRRRMKDLARAVASLGGDPPATKPALPSVFVDRSDTAREDVVEPEPTVDALPSTTGEPTGDLSQPSASTAKAEPPTAAPMPTSDLSQGRQLLAEDVAQRNATNLAAHLELLCGTNASWGGALFNETLQASAADAPWMRETTLLGAAARLGWREGVQAIIQWRVSKVGKENLTLDALSKPAVAGCENNTALQLAVLGGYAEVASELLGFGASAFVANSCGDTPLETALRAGSSTLTAALVQGSGDLADGLVRLRRRLAEAPQTTWPSGTPKDEEQHWRDLVPSGMRPTPNTDLEHVGQKPADWILHFQCRLMCALTWNASNSLELAEVLTSRGYDRFARNYSLSIFATSFISMFFFLFVLLISRLKVYGWLQAPISLAESIPGAFDPARLADPDFDPSRRRPLPYREAKAHFNESLLPRVMQAGSAFWQALFGVFCSWMLQHVRIPPEKDVFDEDYLSDDDEDCRDRVRRHSASRAKLVQRAEVAVRLILLVLLFQWLLVSARRWDDAYLLVSVMVLYSLCTSCVAGVTVPKSAPEQSPPDLDAARLVCGIFGVQHGPTWARSITTTRSTATLKRPKPGARGRRQKVESSPQANKDDDGFSMEMVQALNSSMRRETTDSTFSDQFCHEFLSLGKMHVWHGELLVGQVVYILIICFSMLWLLHLRHWMTGSFVFFYEDRSPTELFTTYGAPGTAFRVLAITLEVLLMVLCSERLYALCMLVHVAILTVLQRHRALEYLAEHPPPPLALAGDKITNVKEAIARMDEQSRCGDFALELSSIRWSVLRGPCEMVYFFAMALYVLASAVHLGEDVSPVLANLRIDAWVPLCLANCLLCPLIILLFQVTSANREVQRARASLMNGAEEALASGGAGSDVEYVTLRMKSTQALCSSVMRWPEGREVRCLDPLLLGTVALATNVFMFL